MEKVEGSIVDETFGCWREEDKGVRYVDKLRKGWKKTRREVLELKTESSSPTRI